MSNNNNYKFLLGSGEMGEIVRQKDWSQHPLGYPSSWPESLITTLSIIFNSKFPMFVFWGEQSISFYNDAYRPSLGENGKHPYILGLPGKEAWGEVWDNINPLIKQVMDGGEATWSDDELLPIFRNGSLENVYWTFSYSPLKDGQGQPIGVLVICTETTEKIINRNKLEETNSQLQFAIEAAELGTWDYNPATNKFTANNRLKAWVGLSASAEIEFHHTTDVIAEKDKDRVMAAIKKALDYSTGGNYDVEYSIINSLTHKEIILHAKGRGWFNAERIAYRFNGILQDVTENVLARRKIEESEEQFRIAIEGSEFGTFDFSPQTNQLAWSSRTKEMFGLPNNAAVSYDTYIAALHPDDRMTSSAIAQQQAHLKEGGLYELEYRVIGITDGKLRWLRSKGKATYNKEGQPIRYTGVIQDITKDKQAEETLRESEERFKAMAEGTDILIGVGDESSNAIYFNKAWVELTGRPRADLLKFGWLDLIHPDDRNDYLNTYLEAFKKKIAFTGEFRVLDKNGHYRWVLAKSLARFMPDGTFAGYISSCIDITERKQSEEALKLFKFMADNASDAFILMRQDASFGYLNNIAKEKWGYSVTELEQLKVPDLDPNYSIQIFNDAFKLAQNHKIPPFETLHKNKQGIIYPVEINMGYISLDGEPFLFAVARDITERKQAEEGIKQNKKRFEAAINATQGILWTNNPDGKMTGVQIGWEGLTGQSHEEYKGYGWATAVHPEDAQPTIDAWKDAVAKRKPFVYEHRLRTKTGNWGIFSIRAIPLINDDGLILEWVGVHTDITEQKKVRQLVEESEQRFSNIANNAPVLVWMAGTDKLCHFFNTAWLTFTGRSMEQEAGNGWAEGIHPEDFSRSLDIYDTNFDKRDAFYMEYRLKRYDGEYRWISNKGVPRFNTNGDFEGYIGACMDIHEQITNQTKVEEAEERVRIATEATGLATWDLDLDTKKIIYSPRLPEIFGHHPSTELVHHEMRQQIHPDDLHDVVKKAFDKAIQTGIYQYEARIIKPNNTISWISTKGKVFYGADKIPIKIIGTLQDITEEKHRQQEIEASEQKFRLLADSMPQQIWTGNADGILNYYNKAVYTFSGLTPEQLEADGWIQIVHPDDREENIKAWVHAVASGEDFLFEHRFRRHDGQYRWQLSRATTQTDANGNIQMWVGSSTDIQDQKTFTRQLEKQVYERTKELEEKNVILEKMNTELQSFAYVSSHDLQEPLRKIQTFTKLIIDKESDCLTGKVTDYFGRIQSAANRMQTLIQDLLAYSRTNTVHHDFVKMDLSEIVNEVKDDFKDQLEENQSILTVGKMCTANIIPFQFRQIMYNLISNAIKFAKKTEPLHINIYSEPVSDSDIQRMPLLLNINYCHITISDNGIGFESDYKEKIFEIFQRLHTKEQYNGTGIGLAIVKKIIDNHNGFITATSQLGEGATFDIYLPI